MSFTPPAAPDPKAAKKAARKQQGIFLLNSVLASLLACALLAVTSIPVVVVLTLALGAGHATVAGIPAFGFLVTWGLVWALLVIVRTAIHR